MIDQIHELNKNMLLSAIDKLKHTLELYANSVDMGLLTPKDGANLLSKIGNINVSISAVRKEVFNARKGV